MPFKAIVFDLDGTLLDTLKDLADACNAALAWHGFPIHPVEAYRYFVGDGVANLITRTLPDGKRDLQTVAAVSTTYRAEYQRRWNLSKPYPGVPEMLDGLAARRFPMAVLSNKPEDFTRQCVTELLPKWKFDVIMGASAAIPHKPHPAGAIQVASMMKFEPGEFLYLGDTSTDMKTAVSAGMYPLGALWGFRTAEELTESGAKKLLTRPEDVLDLLT